ncbi:hypothetical protein LC087_18830 (plasmid) [Bacillus carboniphilus]|uniref:Uncharacterized protein n=1 Tax=Bacillus carboniphilus TaxID=86663 RepID=A0ABY9JYF6_9BACI|nr:hypothetical protein [Bacillus carboniphilus]WLR44439.1 hypothetical protein LC087_18830 [Bacillus carboniphilus]
MNLDQKINEVLSYGEYVTHDESDANEVINEATKRGLAFEKKLFDAKTWEWNVYQKKPS